MRKLFLVVAVIQSLCISAQMGGGGQMGGGMMGGRQGGGPPNQQGGMNEEREPVTSSDAAGIFYYDIDEAIKKVKIKDEGIERSFVKALRKYNDRVGEISFVNTKAFDEIDALMESQMNNGQGRPGSPREILQDYEELKDVVPNARREVNTAERALNEELEEVLSEKQLKKWAKYQRKIKEDLMPQSQNRQGRNQGGGMGQRGGNMMMGGGMGRQ